MTSGANNNGHYPDWMNLFRSNRRLALWAGYVILVLMMGSVSAALMYLGRRLSPNWSGSYLPWVCMVVAAEAMISRSITRDRGGRDKWIYVGSELLLLAILLKLFLYILRGLDQLISDIPRWQQGFETFFEGEYFFVLIPVFLIWLMSGQFAGYLEYLHSDEEDFYAADMGIVGHLEKNRLNTRQRIAELVFLNGMALVFMTAMTRVRTPSSWGIPEAIQAPVLNVIGYFLLTLILMGLIQFTLLQGRWLWQRIPISPKLGANWVRYTVLFFIVLGILAAALPSRYTQALFQPMSVLFSWFASIMVFLMTLFLLPIGYLFSLLSGCNKVTNTAPAGDLEMPKLVQPEPRAPIPWLELVRMIIFYLVFLILIFSALRYYYLNNKERFASLRRFRFFNWLAKTVRAFWNWLRGINQQVMDMVSEGWQRFRPAPRPAAGTARKRINYRGLNARQKVIFLYISLLRRSDERGLARKPSQTPTQYEGVLEEKLPDAEVEVRELTSSFQEARYSQHEIAVQQVDTTQSLLRKILKALQARRSEGNQTGGKNV